MKRLLGLVFFISCAFQSQAQSAVVRDSVSLDQMIGQMILTGIGNFSYMPENAAILDEIRKEKVGGVILFEKNINATSPGKQLARTISMLKEAATVPLFISIDEEGGKVNRLKPKYGFPKTKSAGDLGKINNLDTTAFYATNTASTLQTYGFNVNFAPDVDVAVNPDNPVITKLGRSYSSDPKQVARHAQKVIDVHREYGVLTVLKHFPGHGSSHSDSHLGVADVSKYWQFDELMPYKYLLDSGRIDAIMTAHIVNQHFDARSLPATLSPYVINNILRNMLDYQGVVFSDDMQMHAISSNYGLEESIKMAIDAGVDVLLFCNNVPGNDQRTATHIHEIIKRYVTTGEITEARIQQSYDRIMQLKSKLQ